MRLKDRVALITGASRGIGREIALTFAREGAKLVLVAKTMEPHPKLPGTLPEVAREAEELGAEVLVCQCDVRDEEAIGLTVRSALNRFGKIDILINNAGALWWRPVLETPTKRFDLIMSINVRASFILSREVLPSMIENGWGHIVNMSPKVDLEKLPGFTGYFISKFGMTMLAQGLAGEVKDKNVAANALWPVTAIDTAAVRNYGVGSEEMWRKPSILSDATLELVCKPPSEMTGQALTDEEVLKSVGVTDFSKYAVVEGTEPPPIDWIQEKVRS
ncbi:MAG: SDR family oxidoreductase [Candidatus Omnitrophica bacterium]|nr:SDR family oxidoreductase [Candidatus Omnitrophota bacterium]